MLGLNTAFAPVLDLRTAASGPVMTTRVVSGDPDQVTRYAGHFLRGLARHSVLGCGKHFPGLGGGQVDSHHATPVISKPFDLLWQEDLLPYRELARQLPMVMVSHAAYPLVTGDKIPASLSKVWISAILRKRIGYRNLLVSDDLEMGGVLSAAPVGEAAVAFIRAGGDLCLICHRQTYIEKAYDEIVKTTAQDPKFAQRVAESVRHVLAFKKKSTKVFRKTSPPAAGTVHKLSRKLWEFGEQVRVENLVRTEKVRAEKDRARLSRRPRS